MSYQHGYPAIGQIGIQGVGAALSQQGAYGYEQQGAKVASVLESQINRLHESAKLADLLATRLSALADRVFGAVPEDGKANQAVPAPSSHIGRLHEAHEWIESALRRAQEATARLESL